MKLLECVPNFSEGRDDGKIRQIAAAIEMVAGVKLLNVDSGKAANRTVMTFAGEPEAVAEAAFQAIKAAAEVIDMWQQKGEHPRMGATDVCPFVPLSRCTMEEAVAIARIVAKRVGEELLIPVFLYEEAALQKGRTNLSHIRRGEYEGMAAKLQQPGWQPDFGPGELNLKAGATVIGARDFLIAYNINLNTTSAEKANAVAKQIRESGRRITSVHPETGEQRPEQVPGTLKKVKALGWFIEEYGLAQISMNLTHYHTTSIHQAFDEASRVAAEMGLRVTGSEIVGMVPLEVMKMAGKYYYRQQRLSWGVSDEELVEMAVRSLGLNDSVPFNQNEKIIEFKLKSLEESGYKNLTLQEFANEVSSDLPVPGGGSVAAAVGALAASLSNMVANISARKAKDEAALELFSSLGEKGHVIKNELLQLAEEDSRAFSSVMEALKMSKKTEQQKQLRQEALRAAREVAAQIPLQVMQAAAKVFPLLEELLEKGSKSARTDLGVAALASTAAIRAAHLNIKINLKDLPDSEFKKETEKEAKEIEFEAINKESELLKNIKL